MERRFLGILMSIFSLQAATPVREISLGDTLPMLKGEFLTGRAAVLPEDAKGKAALLMIGFTYDSRFPVEAWAKKFRADFGANPKITFFEIPMIGGLSVIGKPFIDGGMRRGTPKSDQENVITVYGGVDPWKQRVGCQDPKAAYLILIYPTGKVIWRYSGNPDLKPYGELVQAVTALLG